MTVWDVDRGVPICHWQNQAPPTHIRLSGTGRYISEFVQNAACCSEMPEFRTTFGCVSLWHEKGFYVWFGRARWFCNNLEELKHIYYKDAVHPYPTSSQLTEGAERGDRLKNLSLDILRRFPNLPQSSWLPSKEAKDEWSKNPNSIIEYLGWPGEGDPISPVIKPKTVIKPETSSKVRSRDKVRAIFGLKTETPNKD
jgi:hypothetical protein